MKGFPGCNRAVLWSAVLVTVVGAVYFAFLRKDGLDDLSGSPCNGLVEKGAVRKVLPDVREVKTENKLQQSQKDDYRRRCGFAAGEDAHLTITVRSALEDFDNPKGEGAEWTEGERRHRLLSDGTLYISSVESDVLLAPCPTKRDEHNAIAVTVETLGGMRVHGQELRDARGDLAQQAMKNIMTSLSCADP